MFSNHFITNFPQNLPVKKIENRSIFGEDTDKICGLLFGPPGIKPFYRNTRLTYHNDQLDAGRTFYTEL